MCPQKSESLIDPSKDLSIDPSITPYTWQLDQKFRKFAKLRLSDKKHIGDNDDICDPGHLLIADITDLAISLGTLGFIIKGNIENQPDDNLVDILMKGFTSTDIYFSFLPSIGKYILFLWVVRSLIRNNMSEWPSEKAPFKYKFSNDDLKSYPEIDHPAIGLEWFWINELLNLLAMLCEPDIDLIPGFWHGSKEFTIDHPQWKKMRLAALGVQPYLPYIFRQVKAGSRAGKILAIPQKKDLRLLMRMMAALETLIHRTFKTMVLPTWEKMRSQGDLRQDQIDKILQTLMNWQINQWPNLFIDDGKLSATAGYAAYIGDHKDPDQKSWMEKTHRAIKKLYKRRDGIRQGKGREKQNLVRFAHNWNNGTME